MIKLRAELLVEVEVAESLDKRLERGDEDAFIELEQSILKNGVVRCQIMDLGPYNTRRFKDEEV